MPRQIRMTNVEFRKKPECPKPETPSDSRLWPNRGVSPSTAGSHPQWATEFSRAPVPAPRAAAWDKPRSEEFAQHATMLLRCSRHLTFVIRVRHSAAANRRLNLRGGWL